MCSCSCILTMISQFFKTRPVLVIASCNIVLLLSLSYIAQSYSNYLLQIHTHTHYRKEKKRSPAAKQNTAIAPQRISTGMPQLLEFGAGKSSWGSTHKPHKDCPSLTERSHGTRSSTTTPTPLSETRTVGY